MEGNRTTWGIKFTPVRYQKSKPEQEEPMENSVK